MIVLFSLVLFVKNKKKKAQRNLKINCKHFKLNLVIDALNYIIQFYIGACEISHQLVSLAPYICVSSNLINSTVHHSTDENQYLV